MRMIGEAKERFPQIIESLEYLRRLTQKPRLEVQQLQMLMELCAYPDGIAMQDLAKTLGVDPSYVSRNAKAFGQGSVGKRLIGLKIDEENPRQRLLFLTGDGLTAMRTFSAIGAGTRDAPRLPVVQDARKQ